MKNKKAALIFFCLFFVYIVLSMFDSLYWSASYEGNALVNTIGEITDGEALEVLWIPGQVVGFFLSVIMDADGSIPGALLTLAVGAVFTMKAFKISFADLKISSAKTEDAEP